jgi:uncharacterized protein (DUF924 family)
MFRGTAEAFATDAMALALARTAVTTGADRRVPRAARMFLYMPFMHSEELSVQDQCTALFERWLEEAPGDDVANAAKYAIAHRDIVLRFGRFPHRNEALGRVSTPEEEAFLAAKGASFGQ